MTLRIGITGCGVAGLTAALLTARQGHAVTLFEQADTVGPIGAGVLLQPSGQLALARMGLLAEVLRRAEPIDRLYATTHEGRTLIDLPYGELSPGCRAYGLHRGDLFTVLHEAVRALGVPILLGRPIERALEGPDGATLLDEQGERHGPFDLVLIADGARSRLRGRSGLSHTVHEYPHGALWALGRTDAVRGRLWQVTRGTHKLCGLLPMGEGRCSLFWSLRREDKDALFARGLAAFQDEVVALLPAAAELLGAIRSFDELRFTTYHHVRMPAWHGGRCLLLGDAAHAMSPHLGQGINLALLDAWVLAACLEGGTAPGEALARYERARRGHVRFYALLTYLLSPFFQSDGWLRGRLRDLFLPMLPRVPGLRRQILLAMAGVKGGLLQGALALPPADPPP